MAGPDLFDPNYWYRLGTNSTTTGLGYALDVADDGFPNGYADLILMTVSVSSGQYWRPLFQGSNHYQLYSKWPGGGYRLGTSTNNDYAPENHTALYTDESVDHPDYDWNIVLVTNGTFILQNPRTMMVLSTTGYDQAWTITEIEPISNDTIATPVAGVSTVFNTCSNPSCTTDATGLDLSSAALSSSIQPSILSSPTPSSISSSQGELETSILGQSIATLTPSSTTQPPGPTGTVDPATSALTTTTTPNGKLPMRTAIGIGVGAAVGGLFLCVFVVCIFMRRRKRASANHDAHGTDDNVPCHTEAKPELDAQKQQCAEPTSELSVKEPHCAEPCSELVAKEQQCFALYPELSGDQGTMPPHMSELGGPYTSRMLGSNNSTRLELE